MWRIEISCKRFFRLRINLFNDTIFLPKIYFWTNILLPFKAIWEERGKRGLMSYLSAWGRGPRLSLKINAQPAKPDLFTKNGNVGTDDSTTHGAHVAVPVGRDRKIRTIILQDSSLCPLRKKWIPPILSGCKVIFLSPEEARKNMSNEQISARILC